MPKKFIINGHLPHKHTHSFIHQGYYDALQYLGVEVEWVKALTRKELGNLKDSVIITANNCIDKDVPKIHKTSFMFCHNLRERAEDKNVCNLLVKTNTIEDKSLNWEAINECSSFTRCGQNFVTMWGTDLLPNQIKHLSRPKSNPNNEIYFVGTAQGREFQLFKHSAIANNFRLKNLGGYTGSKKLIPSRILRLAGVSPFVTKSKNIELTRRSIFAFDIREQVHLANGYIPCRLFKAISYGRKPGTNSKFAKDFFGNLVTYSESSNLPQETLDSEDMLTEKELADNANFILENHTYVNRIKDMITFLSNN